MATVYSRCCRVKNLVPHHLEHGLDRQRRRQDDHDDSLRPYRDVFAPAVDVLTINDLSLISFSMRTSIRGSRTPFAACENSMMPMSLLSGTNIIVPAPRTIRVVYRP